MRPWSKNGLKIDWLFFLKIAWISSKNSVGRGRSSKNNGYWSKNRTCIHTHIRIRSALHVLKTRLQVTLYIYKIELNITILYIQRLKIGLKIDPLLQKIKPGIGLKINRYRPKTCLKIALSLSAPYSSFKNIEAVLRAGIQVIRNIETMPHENK